MAASSFYAYRMARELSTSITGDEHLADVYASSNIDVYPYQIAAARFALRSPYLGGVVLCDEGGLGYAIEESVNIMADEASRLRSMVEAAINHIKKNVPPIRINGDNGNKLPGIVNIGLDGVSGESLMHLLDLKGICVSTSSACTSGEDKASHVLLALGQTEQQAKSAIRISYGRYNAIDEIETVVKAICDAYDKIIAYR